MSALSSRTFPVRILDIFFAQAQAKNQKRKIGFMNVYFSEVSFAVVDILFDY